MHAIKYHVVCWETYFEIIHWHSDHSSKWYHSNVSLQRKKRRYYTEVSLAPEIGFISHQEADWAKLLLGLFLLLVTCVGGKSKQNFRMSKNCKYFSFIFLRFEARPLFYAVFKSRVLGISILSHFSHQFYWAAHFSSPFAAHGHSLSSVVLLIWAPNRTQWMLSTTFKSIQMAKIYERNGVAENTRCVIYRLSAMTQASRTLFSSFMLEYEVGWSGSIKESESKSTHKRTRLCWR